MDRTPEVPHDYFATELIAAQKASNKRMFIIIVSLVLALVCVVAGFLWYLNQYDFTSYDSSTTNASGVYAVVDSDGNILASDLTKDDITFIMEAIAYGEDNKDPYTSPEED